jgi:glycogen operon protein
MSAAIDPERRRLADDGDADWYRPDGEPMTADDWNASYARAVTVALSGEASDGQPADTPFLLMVNAWWDSLEFHLPRDARTTSWSRIVDTAQACPPARPAPVAPATGMTLAGRLLLLLQGLTPAR